jgi:hypothetical protein
MNRYRKDEVESPPRRKIVKQHTESTLSASVNSKAKIIRLKSRVEESTSTSQQIFSYNVDVTNEIHRIQTNKSQMSLVHQSDDKSVHQPDDLASNFRAGYNTKGDTHLMSYLHIHKV